jgi:hypothetical protein
VGAPPETIRAVPSPGTAAPASRSASAAASIVAATGAAPQSSVIRSASTRSRIESPRTSRCTTWGTPSAAAASGRPQPLTWNIGSVCR